MWLLLSVIPLFLLVTIRLIIWENYPLVKTRNLQIHYCPRDLGPTKTFHWQSLEHRVLSFKVITGTLGYGPKGI